MEGRGLDYVTQERDTSLDIVNRVLLLQVAHNAGNFLTR